ncbi:hypothetical protein [Deinococcus aquaticus]|uniref:hypothetical protein n=1 Tax=Deinococcus aquaticus TaxID=328692 RepID=UPI003F4493CD
MTETRWQRTYSPVALRNVATGPQPPWILTSGVACRHPTGTLLTDRGHALTLIGEPLGWLPRHEQQIDVWGQLLPGTPPVLLVHDARPLGDHRHQPLWTPPRPQGFEGHIEARVTTYGTTSVAVTAQRHHYLLDRVLQPDGLYRLTGRVSQLTPPTFTFSSATPTGD